MSKNIFLPLLYYYKQIIFEFSLASISSYSFFHSLYFELKSLPHSSSIIPSLLDKIIERTSGSNNDKGFCKGKTIVMLFNNLLNSLFCHNGN